MKEVDLTYGRVKFVNNKKGFGFIEPDDGSPDVWFHFKHVKTVQRKGAEDIMFCNTRPGGAPKEGEQIIFKVQLRGEGPRAQFWAYYKRPQTEDQLISLIRGLRCSDKFMVVFSGAMFRGETQERLSQFLAMHGREIEIGTGNLRMLKEVAETGKWEEKRMNYTCFATLHFNADKFVSIAVKTGLIERIELVG